MARIFISYSRTDEAFARSLTTALTARGVDVWLDVEQIPVGANWGNSIQAGLDSCDAMMVIISPRSMASENVQVEWQYYYDQRKPILPVLHETAKIHFQISRLQYVDFVKNPFEVGIERLIGQLHRMGLVDTHVGVPSDSTPAQPVQSSSPALASRRRTLPSGVVIGGIALLVVAAVLVFVLPNLDGTTTVTPTSATVPTTILPTITPIPYVQLVIALQDIPRGNIITMDAVAFRMWPQESAPFNLIGDMEAVIGKRARTNIFREQPILTVMLEDVADGESLIFEPSMTPTTAVDVTATAQQVEFLAGRIPVEQNADWTPVYDSFGGVEMALVPAGCFTIGSDDGGSNERNGNELCFDQPFWIDRFEVSNAQYRQVMNAEPPSNWKDDDRPVERISWNAARDYCKARDANLPTEVQWEYAARGPDALMYPWGDEFASDNVTYFDNSGNQTAAVDNRPGGVSWVGALNLSGNVWEWTMTLYQDYPYPEVGSADERARNDENSTNVRVARGGSFSLSMDFLRSAFRGVGIPDSESDIIGFRCVRF